MPRTRKAIARAILDSPGFQSGLSEIATKAGLSPADLKKFLFSQKMVRCDEAAWKFMDISMAGWNAILSGGLALLLGQRVMTHLRTKS